MGEIFSELSRMNKAAGSDYNRTPPMDLTLATNASLPSDQEGGISSSSYHLAHALLEAGASVRIVATDRNGGGRVGGPVDTWTEFGGVPVFYARAGRGRWFHSASYARAVRDAVRESDACIMSAVFWSHTGLSAWHACREFGVPYLTMPRGLLSPWALAHKRLKKAVYWRALARRIVNGSAAVVALAEGEADDIRRAGIEQPVHVVPNGASLGVSPLLRDTASGYPGIDDILAPIGSARYVLYIGRIHEKKGLDVLISAFAEVARDDANLALVMAGTVDPAYARAFASLLSTSTVRQRILHTAHVNPAQREGLLRRAEVFALASYGEGQPVAVLEALAAGVPVVVTPACNLPEVTSWDAGIEAPPEREAVAGALSALLTDKTRRARQAANASRLAHERFNWTSVGRRMLDLCEASANWTAAPQVPGAQVEFHGAGTE